MNVLYMKDGRPFVFSTDDSIAPDRAAEISERLSNYDPTKTLVLSGETEVRQWSETPQMFVHPPLGTATLGYDARIWPLAALFSGVAAFVVGLLVGINLP